MLKLIVEVIYFMFKYSENDIIKAKSAYFTSLDPIRLRQFPSKQKKKYIVLKILENYIPDKVYSEKEISELLKEIYPDFVTIRGALIDYKLFERTKDGSKYWKNKKGI